MSTKSSRRSPLSSATVSSRASNCLVSACSSSTSNCSVQKDQASAHVARPFFFSNIQDHSKGRAKCSCLCLQQMKHSVSMSKQDLQKITRAKVSSRRSRRGRRVLMSLEKADVPPASRAVSSCNATTASDPESHRLPRPRETELVVSRGSQHLQRSGGPSGDRRRSHGSPPEALRRRVQGCRPKALQTATT